MSGNNRRLIDIAALMAQELAELVQDAIDCSGDKNAMDDTQELLKLWNNTYKASALTDADHFQEERRLADNIGTVPRKPTQSINRINDATLSGISSINDATLSGISRGIDQSIHMITGRKLAFFLTIFSDDDKNPIGLYTSNAPMEHIVPETMRLLRNLSQSRRQRRTVH